MVWVLESHLLHPAETLAGLVIFLDFVLLFLVTAQRIRRVENVERLLRWCGLSAVVMASFGIVQYLTANGKFFWFYEHPFSDTCHGATGSFTNRNHFAECLALGVGPLIWWLQDAMRQGADASASPTCPWVSWDWRWGACCSPVCSRFHAGERSPCFWRRSSVRWSVTARLRWGADSSPLWPVPAY